MTEEKQETRAEEVARVRRYLASQAMKRTPAQLVDSLREAHQQFLGATSAVPGAVFRIAPADGEWSAADVLGHVLIISALDRRYRARRAALRCARSHQSCLVRHDARADAGATRTLARAVDRRRAAGRPVCAPGYPLAA